MRECLRLASESGHEWAKQSLSGGIPSDVQEPSVVFAPWWIICH